MTRFRILTAIPLAALALSVTVAAAPADAARHGKHHQKHHTSKSRGHRTHKPKKSSTPAEVNPAEGAASEGGPDTEPAQPTAAVALIVRKGPADVRGCRSSVPESRPRSSTRARPGTARPATRTASSSQRRSPPPSGASSSARPTAAPTWRPRGGGRRPSRGGGHGPGLLLRLRVNLARPTEHESPGCTPGALLASWASHGDSPSISRRNASAGSTSASRKRA